jgi:hypothetical protein
MVIKLHRWAGSETLSITILSTMTLIKCCYSGCYYCERSPNETSACVQSVYGHDSLSSNQQSIYVNCQQVKWNGE